jgi:hypothetical protein
MSGYKDGATLPAYRRVGARLQFLHPVHGWRPVISGEHQVSFGGSIGEIIRLVEGDGDMLVSPAPPAIVQEISRDLDYDVDVRRVISKAAIGSIVDVVRNSILDWALQLEQAGVLGEGLSFTRAESAKAQSVVFHIGSIGNATGLGAFGANANIIATSSGDVTVMAEKTMELVEKAEKIIPNQICPRRPKRQRPINLRS